MVEELQHPTPDGGVLGRVQDDSSIIGTLAFAILLLLLPPVELRATSASVAARAEADTRRGP